MVNSKKVLLSGGLLAFSALILFKISQRRKKRANSAPEKPYLTRCFDSTVDAIATLSSAILSHPTMKQTLSDIMVKGMNEFMLQQDLDEKLVTMNATLSRRQPDLARHAGEDFPKLVGSFIQGMLLQPKEKEAKLKAAGSSPTSSKAPTNEETIKKDDDSPKNAKEHRVVETKAK